MGPRKSRGWLRRSGSRRLPRPSRGEPCSTSSRGTRASADAAEGRGARSRRPSSSTRNIVTRRASAWLSATSTRSTSRGPGGGATTGTRHSPDRPRMQFSSAILPPYLRKSKSDRGADSLAVPQRNFHRGFLGRPCRRWSGRQAKGLSPNVIVRLKEQWSQEYDAWSRRDLTGQAVRLRLGRWDLRECPAGRRGQFKRSACWC